MKKFRVLLMIKGHRVETIIHAPSVLLCRVLAIAQYGTEARIDNVIEIR
jgi:hypothetical protein